MPQGFDHDSEVVIGKKYILGIGINAYLNKEWPKLGNAVKDMDDVIRLLTNRYQFDGISKLTDSDATRDNIENELYRFTDETVLGPDDSLLIYYSGHGYLDNNQRGYWVPVGAKKGMIASYLPNSRILEIISDMKARHVLLISDSCYSGSLFTQNRSESKDDLLAHEYEKRKSRWAFCSGRSDEEVSDGTNGNSPFAQALISELNANSTGRINLGRIADRVARYTFNNSKQLPAFGPLQNTGDFGGQFVFTLKGFVPSPEENIPTQPTPNPTATRGGGGTDTPTHTGTLTIDPASISSRKELADAIKKLLADDQTGEAIKLIIAYEDAGLSKVRDTAILLSGRWKALEREDQEGTIDNRELQAGKNKLRGNVLTLVDSIHKPTGVSEMDALKSELRTDIARAKTSDAIKKLLNLTIPEMTEDTRTVVYGISSEWEKYKKDELRGVLDSRDAEKTRNVINFKLLDIISSL